MPNFDIDEDERVSYDHTSPQDDLLREKLDQMNPQRFERDQFLDAISQIESNGGKNLNHPIMQGGIHAGEQAIGKYGLMPNTVEEMARRTRGPASVTPGSPEEQAVAQQLAERVLNRFQDPEMAAYAWNSGHNLTPKEVKERDYQHDPYVEKFKKIWHSLGRK